MGDLMGFASRLVQEINKVTPTNVTERLLIICEYFLQHIGRLIALSLRENIASSYTKRPSVLLISLLK